MDLFKFDMSFFGWFILTIVTFGIAGLYFQPYYQMSKAIYYSEYFSNKSDNEGKIEVENIEYAKVTENVENAENAENTENV